MRRGGHELMHRRQIGETKQFGGNKKQTTTDLKNIEARKKYVTLPSTFFLSSI